MNLQEQIIEFLNSSEKLNKLLTENRKLRIQYLDRVINILIEARREYSQQRLRKIDEARSLLEEWKSTLTEDN